MYRTRAEHIEAAQNLISGVDALISGNKDALGGYIPDLVVSLAQTHIMMAQALPDETDNTDETVQELTYVMRETEVVEIVEYLKDADFAGQLSAEGVTMMEKLGKWLDSH